MKVSTSPDRSKAINLSNSKISKSVAIFATSPQNLRSVSFYLDDPRMRSAPRRIDSGAPFDFAGTAANGSAVLFDISALSVGRHEIDVKAARVNGSSLIGRAVFTVVDPSPPATPTTSPTTGSATPTTSPTPAPPATTAAAPTTTTAPPATVPQARQGCPPLPAHPTPGCTGVPNGTALAALAGDQVITQDGAIIDGRHVTGSVIVKARNVVIRNSVIDGGISNDFDGTDYSFAVSDTTIGPSSGCLGTPGVSSQNFTATRVEIRGHEDGFQLAQPGAYGTVRDSFARTCGLTPQQDPPDGSHSDGFQAYCPHAACGAVTIEHSTLEEGSPFYTAPVFAGDSASNGHPTGLSLTGNLLIGGVYSIYVGWQGGPDYTITDNVVAAPSTGFRSWDFGPATSNGTCAHQAWSGNQIVTLDANYATTGVVAPQSCIG